MARYRTRAEKRMEEALNENAPMDMLPYSNEEHFPEDPQPWQLEMMKLQDEEIEYQRKRFGMSRRAFVRTGAAFGVGLWALNKVTAGKWGYYDVSEAGEINNPVGAVQPEEAHACNLNNPGVQLDNLPGEFIFDVQSHHVQSDGRWRALQPVHMAFICGVLSTGGNEIDRCTGTNRIHYYKEVFLDSSTTAGVLSPIPSHPDEQQPLPFDEANETARLMEELTGTMRVVTHGYVMPNRGWVREQPVGCAPDPTLGQLAPEVCAADTGESTPHTGRPLFLDQELEWMEERALKYRRYLRGWKVYTPYGDVPFASGMRHDDDTGMEMNEKILEITANYGIPPVLASHKGVWLPTFDNKAQACDDVPGAAMAYPDIRFVIYHSGGGGGNFYPTDEGNDDSTIDTKNFNFRTNGLIRSLKIHGWDARSHIPAGLEHGNSPNVYVDTGSVLAGGADGLAIFFGKMIYHIGMRRICHGTDAIWGGSPQGDIVRIRNVEMTEALRQVYNLPHGFEGDRFDPRINAHTGAHTNAAAPVNNAYTQQYLDWFLTSGAGTGQPGKFSNDPAEHNKIVANWPKDGGAHPERTLRNGILGWNASDAYEHDGNLPFGELDCAKVQRLRDEYMLTEYEQHASLGGAVPLRSNMIYGPRTKQDVIRGRNEGWKKDGWTA